MATRTEEQRRHASGWVARGLLAVSAVAAIWWGIVTLPVFLDQMQLDATRDLVLRNIPLSDKEIGLLDPLLAEASMRAECMPAIDRSVAIIRLRALDNAFDRDDHRLVEQRMTALDTSVRKSLGCMPRDPYLWLVMFWLSNTREGFNEKNWDMLRMSYRLGPNEAWIVQKRSRLVLVLFNDLPVDLRGQAISEFAGLVKSELYGPAIELLVGPGWRYRKQLMAAIEPVSPQNAATLIKSITSLGYEFDRE